MFSKSLFSKIVSYLLVAAFIAGNPLCPGLIAEERAPQTVGDDRDNLSPVLKFGFTIGLEISSDEQNKLKEWSDAIGKSNVEGAETTADSAEALLKEAVSQLIGKWLKKIKTALNTELGKDDGQKEWQKFVDNDVLWGMLLAQYINQYTVNGADLKDSVKNIITETFNALRAEEKGTPGMQAIGRVLELSEAKRFDEVIRKSFVSGKYEIMPKLGNEGIIFVLHKGLIEALEASNLPPNIHPGRGGDALGHEGRQIHIDEDLYNSLRGEDILQIAQHETFHLALTEIARIENLTLTEGEKEQAIKVSWLGSEGLRLRELWRKDGKPVGQKQEDFINNNYPGAKIAPGIGVYSRIEEITFKRIKTYREKREAVKQALLHNADIMSISAESNIGPDVVIVVSSLEAQADFWQKRLTGENNINGSGSVIKKDAIVLSVTESNWKGGAGNALGTLNGFMQAARKARDLGLIDIEKNLTGKAEITALTAVFMEFIKGKNTAMFHTAGKGTRTAPLPGVELNSKPNIKLSKMIDVKGVKEPITILESAIINTNPLADSRKGRLSVFWGDQVIIPVNNVDSKGTHHIEILGQEVPLDKEIESYGVLIPGENGDISQREKLSLETIQELLPEGETKVYKSIGSFSITQSFLNALLNDETIVTSLVNASGVLNTDQDWWQALTSSREEYISTLTKKGVEQESAEQQWNTMKKLWDTFKSEDNSGLRLLGSTDVGEDALWWDYGQNKFYLENMQLLVENTMRGEVARQFFGISKKEWIKDSKIFTDVKVSNSIIQNSTIKGGRLENCVVINSELKNVFAKNAIIIGSTVIELHATGGLVYNVVSKETYVKEGQIIANIFHPKAGRIVMRTDIDRNGEKDWKGNIPVYDNLYTYPEVAELMKGKGVTVETVENTKRQYKDELLKSGIILGNEISLYKQAETLAHKRNIAEELARLEISYRIIEFGGFIGNLLNDVEYGRLFSISLPMAKIETDKLKKILEERGSRFLFQLTQDTPGIYSAGAEENVGKKDAKFVRLGEIIKNGGLLKFTPYFRSGTHGYTWGQPVSENFILELMGANTQEEKINLARQYGVASDDVIGERWVTTGIIDLGTAGNLSENDLSLYQDEIFGKAHVKAFGAESGITAKLLVSAKPLSLQIHEFSEMIIPLEDGYAYLGLKKDVTTEEFIQSLKDGDMSIFNKVDFKKGEAIIVPAGMPHAYGKVKVYEVKAVNATQDAKGTLSFYDRLKLNEREINRVKDIVSKHTKEEATRILISDKLVRDKKDVLTLDEAKVAEIAEKIEKYGFLKRADLSKVYFNPEVLYTQDSAKYELMGKAEGFESGRYNIPAGKTIEMYSQMEGRQHSLVITEGKVEIINSNGKVIDEMNQGEERMVPAIIGKYTIKALKDAVIYTQYKPFSTDAPESEHKVVLDMGQREEAVSKASGTSVSSHEDAGYFGARGMNEKITIYSAATLPRIIGERDHLLKVISGELLITGSDGATQGAYKTGEVIRVTKDGIIDRNGIVISSMKDGVFAYTLQKNSAEPAEIEIQYEKSQNERIVYAVYTAIEKHLPAILKSKIDLILPEEIFIKGAGEGSKKAEQKLFDTLLGNDVVNIHTYSNSAGLDQNAVTTKIKNSIKNGRTPVLGATNLNITSAQDISNEEFKEIMASVRTLALPDISEIEKGNNGWFFAREVSALGILQSLLTVKSISDKEGIALDMQRVMTQLTNKNVSVEDLYYMLPFESVPAEIKEKEGVISSLQWMVQLVHKLLLAMPIKAFDAREQLEQRRKVMWSA
ncbi:conserved hypothetical protein, secreted [Candidatus Omnitrophus magneticus]|uniref:Uncharacterized protein n=1 Tax=Candidatus Omnitrophus magneticus TaxID=1609969 RepID=A0A0F0CUK9_9BACT|nr:conserved hypothetical protein, secreted [Candidatus Omnitrophus magneticus]